MFASPLHLCVLERERVCRCHKEHNYLPWKPMGNLSVANNHD